MKIIFAVLLVFLTSLAQAKDVDVVFSGYKSPYVILNNDAAIFTGDKKGMEVDIVSEALKIAGFSLRERQLEPSKLKKELRDNKRIEAASGVNRVRDKFYYSQVVNRLEIVAITKSKNNIDIETVSDIAPYTIGARQGLYSALGKEFRKRHHPRRGALKERYFEYVDYSYQVSDFFNDEVEVLLIDIDAFNYHQEMQRRDGVDDEVDIHRVFPTEIWQYVAFKNKKLRNKFDKALDMLKYEGTYKNSIEFYKNYFNKEN